MEKVFAKSSLDIQHYSLQWDVDAGKILDTEFWIGLFPFAKPLSVDIIYQFDLNEDDEENFKFTLFKFNNKIYANIVVILEDYHKDIVVEVVKKPKSIEDLIEQSCLCETDGTYTDAICSDLVKMLSYRKTDLSILFGDIFEELEKLKI